MSVEGSQVILLWRIVPAHPNYLVFDNRKLLPQILNQIQDATSERSLKSSIHLSKQHKLISSEQRIEFQSSSPCFKCFWANFSLALMCWEMTVRPSSFRGASTIFCLSSRLVSLLLGMIKLILAEGSTLVLSIKCSTCRKFNQV